ncbi:hypothetical protein BPA01_00430 [Brevibacillus parabrevis]|uniref:Uncharacterized protein n=1 Tax=Brevibacillus parabrevis TaxID=54914 RepID=A0A4Y3PA73_BREPA|nr:hypothetical protein BPA01_00430 [Brevibacillus parabrevis]
MTKGKSIFTTDEALFKMLYLATTDVTRKWTGRVQNWGKCSFNSPFSSLIGSGIACVSSMLQKGLPKYWSDPITFYTR